MCLQNGLGRIRTCLQMSNILFVNLSIIDRLIKIQSRVVIHLLGFEI
jgi:hypothetical protein